MAIIEKWEVENPAFWKETGSRIAWRTLAITTLCLLLSFSTWFVMSAVVVRLPQIGFEFTKMQFFWLAAMPGLAGGTLRIIHMFLIPIFGTRQVVAWATLLKLLPCIGLGLAVMDPSTPFWVFIALALLTGLGGGDFSSFMPSTSFFFPKRLQGAALGIQAGIGNFGVSLTQFVTPWIIAVASLGVVTGAPQIFTKGDIARPIWLQNAAFWYIPFIILMAVVAGLWLRSVPVKTSFKDQL
ncbi:MAG: MFS transporter, partial [Elusimicrobiota bacterium]